MQNQPRVSGFREAISPNGADDHYAHSTISSNWSGHPPSYQQWPELHHTVSPQDPAGISLSNKQQQTVLPQEISQSGLESVWADEGDKEVIPRGVSPMPPEAVEKKPARVCGLKRGIFWLLLIAAILLVIGLGAGLGAGLGTKNKHKSSSSSTSTSATPSASGGAATSSPTLSSDYYIGGALDPSYYSTKGAFNGTGLALASQSFGSGEYGEMVLYFQHHTGDIRWQRLSSNDGWVGGTDSEVVASDAKNSTPLSAVAYVINQTSTWHLFYVDGQNRLREKINSNVTNIWVEGPLSGENHTVMDADQVGVQACWYGNDYGDSDYIHTPLPGQSPLPSSTSNSSNGSEIGMHMWYASDASTFQQLGWRHGDTNWTFQQSWEDKNGHAGVACYSWGSGTTTYVMFVNINDTAEIWWKDTNTNTTSTKEHPINVWTNTSMAVNNVHPSTSLGYTNAFYAQSADHSISGYNISWGAENSTMESSFEINLEDGLPGTHMTVTSLPDASGGNTLWVFYQVEGDDVTYFTRDLVQGTWTMSTMPVPDT